jgi:hypothetical protein
MTRYLEKVSGDLSTEDSLLRFLESLSVADWLELLKDLALEPARLHQIVRVGPGEDIVSVVATFFQRVGQPTCRLIGDAIEELIYDSPTAPSSSQQSRILAVCLYIARVLPGSVAARLLRDLVTASHISPDSRFAAAAALASHAGESPTFWLSVDLTAWPSLLGPAMTALTRFSPAAALNLLSRVGEEPPDLRSFEYPIRIALRELRDSDKSGALYRATIARLPKWTRSIVEEVVEDSVASTSVASAYTTATRAYHRAESGIALDTLRSLFAAGDRQPAGASAQEGFRSSQLSYLPSVPQQWPTSWIGQLQSSQVQ